MSNPKRLWAIQAPGGELLPATLSQTREEAYWALFPLMPVPFQKKYWYQAEASRRQYPRLGYKAIRVRLVPAS